MKKIVICLTKYPEKWKVKTRLAKSIGEDNAKEIQREFIKNIAKLNYKKKRDYDFVFCLKPYEKKDLFEKEFLVEKKDIFKTKWDWLWEVMKNIFLDFLKNYEQVILIWSDIPFLKENIFKKAFKKLEKNDIVLWKTYDWWYYLVWMKKDNTEIFEDIVFSTKEVFRETINKAKKLKLKVWLIDKKRDIDEIEDLKKEEKIDKSWFIKNLEKYTIKNKISIIIPSYKDKNNLKKTLNNLLKISINTEIIISDSSWESLYIKKLIKDNFKNKNIIYQKSSWQTRSKALNSWAKKASWDILVFLHSDSRLPKNYFEVLSNLDLEIYNYWWFYKKFDSKNLFLKLNAFITNLRLKYFSSLLWDNAIFVEKKLFEKIWWFKDIELMEDVEISKSLKKEWNIFLIKEKTITSPRRFEKYGVLKTLAKMTYIRTLYLFWAKTKYLKNLYK